jgi:signal transduction histidine kinase
VVVEAGFWLDDLVGRELLPRTGSILVFPRGGETVLLSSSCESLQADVPMGLQATRVASGRIHFEHEDQDQIASLVGLQTQPWTTAAYARTAAFLAPLQQLQASYWVFVLLLALATVLAFSMLLNRVVISLEDLTAAAAQIGEGELNPWLPPPGRDEVGRLSLAFSIMLERIRNMMQRMDHSGRLAVVGQLTSYLAHEIRNPLSSIRMNLQSLQRDLRKGRIPEDCGEAVEVSLREVDRLSNSLTSVLQLGRPSGGERETVSVHDIVEDAADLLTAEYRRGSVRLELDLDARADRVFAVKGQLKGVFLNLLMNALEAQPDGGRVQIRSRLVSTPGRGPSVAVHIRDHGRGVSPEIRTRIFEPFFTTKNQGSGIGLAVALRTVREHGGNLLLAELHEADAGSEFVVELPLAAMVAGSMPEPAVDLPSWMEAEDEPPVSLGPGKHPEGRPGIRSPYGESDSPWIPVSIEIPDRGGLH